MEKFNLGKKWFWIGVVIALIQPICGLIYGIALLVEKDAQKRKSAYWILAISVISFILVYLLNRFIELGAFNSRGEEIEFLKPGGSMPTSAQ